MDIDKALKVIRGYLDTIEEENDYRYPRYDIMTALFKMVSILSSIAGEQLKKETGE